MGAPEETVGARAPGVVARRALYERLSAGVPAGVTLVSAPPGSGKTVLLRSWIDAAGLNARTAWAVAIMGVLGIVAGVVTFMWPGLTALSLLYLVAIWAIATGTFQVIAAVALRRELDGEFWMALGGVASILFGALLVAFPGGGLITLVWLVGIWSLVFGASSLGLAYRLHEIDAALPKPAQRAPAH